VITDDPIATLERELVRAAGELHRAPTRRRRPRRTAILSAAVLAVPAAAAILLVVALSGGGSSPSLLARASAAFEPRGGIVHLRLATTFSDRPTRGESDVWIADGTERWRSVEISTRTGRVRQLDDSVRTARSLQTYSSRGNLTTTMSLCGVPVSSASDFALSAADPITVVRERVLRRQITDAGPTTFDGIAVERYVARTAAPRRGRPQFLLDRSTGRPVAMIFPDGDAGRAVTRFTLDERLPLTTANRALLGLGPHPGAHRLTGHAVCH
jgi:hypothetical protein